MATKTEHISSLIPDAHNFNKGNQRGTGMLEDSLRKYGAGRSILVDKNGIVMAGNKTLESAASIGLENIQIVSSDGQRLIVVQRTDIDIETPEGRGLCLADNRISEVNLDWDVDEIKSFVDDGLDISDFWRDDEFADLMQTLPDFEPAGANNQGGQKPEVECPSCGHHFALTNA